MLKNYFKIAFRNIKKYKSYSIINIIGLSIGIACTIMILLWISDELSFDRFHENADHIYRVVNIDYTTNKTFHSWLTPPPLAPALKENFPEIVNAARYRYRRNNLVKYGEQHSKETGAFTDPAIFEIFTFHFIHGNPQTALADPNSIVITEKMAHKYFQKENPINQILNVENLIELKVTGVIADMPPNSEFQFDFITPLINLNEFYGIKDFIDNWRLFGFQTFVLLPEGVSVPELNQKIAGFHEKNDPSHKVKLYLQPLKEVHLHALGGGGKIIYVYSFSLIALFILIIACINFTNLATARSAKRAKEVGLRKVVGANRLNIIKQFFGESILLSIIALFLALIIVELFLPAFNNLTAKQLRLNLFSNTHILSLIVITLITGLIAGSYPALFLSAFQPAHVLKAPLFKSALSQGRLRKILVVIQFSLSIILIICSLLVSNQLEYIRNKNLGFEKANLVFLPLNDQLIDKYETVREELLRNPAITSVTTSSVLLGTQTNLSEIQADWEGKDDSKKIGFHVVSVEFDFIKTFQMEIIEGRDFCEEITYDWQNVIINEEAVKQMGLENPVEKRFSVFGGEGKIIGVVKNFHLTSLHDRIEPIILTFCDNWNHHLVARINTDNVPEVIHYLKDVYEKCAPDFVFEYHFLDEDFEQLYRSEQRMGQLFKYFTLLAIFISCLGLFGLAAFTTEQRTKEIGIRKVLGASITSILTLLSKDITKWILIANIIAWPTAWFVMSKWLERFAYRIPIDVGTFFLAGFLVVLIALLTVSYQSIKAALTNPVNSLKYE